MWLAREAREVLSLLKLTVQQATTKGVPLHDAIDWRMGWLALYHIIILIWSFSHHVAGGTPVPAALLLCEPYGEQQEQQKQINTNQWTRGHALAPLLWPTTKKLEEPKATPKHNSSGQPSSERA